MRASESDAHHDDWVAVCTLDALTSESNRMQRVMFHDIPVAVCYVDGEVWAVQDTCTHSEASLSSGYLENYTIECPMHGGCFDIRTGEPICLPAEVKLKRFAVEIRKNTVYLNEKNE